MELINGDKKDFGPWSPDLMGKLLLDLREKQPKAGEETLKILQEHGFEMEPNGRLYRKEG